MSKIKVPTVSIISLIGLIMIEPSVYLLLIFLSILCHELGHLILMRFFGVGVSSVVVLPVGIDIKKDDTLISYPRELMISLAGPIVNVILFLIFCSRPGYACFFAYSNLLYAIVNLVPVKGLDGGAALESLLLCFLDPFRADSVLRIFSILFCILLWMVGVYILLILDGNFSIFALAVFLFASVALREG